MFGLKWPVQDRSRQQEVIKRMKERIKKQSQTKEENKNGS